MAHAEIQDKTGLWFMVLGQGIIKSEEEKPSKFRWWLDAQTRFSDDTDGID